MTIKLMVNTSQRLFDAYWYGYGTVEQVPFANSDVIQFTIDYGDDEYHAAYQDGRFASGLIFSTIIKEDV